MKSLAMGLGMGHYIYISSRRLSATAATEIQAGLCRSSADEKMVSFLGSIGSEACPGSSTAPSLSSASGG